MRKKYIKAGGQETPAVIKKMGLDKEYQEFVKHCIEREKTKRIIYEKNPPHYKCKGSEVDVYFWEEDLFEIRGETMFGKKEYFLKEDLYKY
jgi:hypothetical protein